MSTGWKMVASALVSAAVTAALFLTFWDRPPPAPAAPPGEPTAGAPDEPSTPGESSEGRWAPPIVPDLPADLPVIRGDGVIRGRVATAAGAGVEGIVIEAVPSVWPSRRYSSDAPPERDLDEAIGEAIVATHQRVTGVRRATTDENGNYVLTGLGDAEYRVSAYSPDHTLRVARGHDASGARPGATVDFTAKTVVRLRVLVEGVDPSLPGPVGILRANDEEGLERAGMGWWYRDRPVIKLAPGTWWLQAVQGDERERQSSPVEIILEAGGPEQTVVLSLTDRPGLRGAIVVNDGLFVRRAEVYALRFEGEKPPPLDPMGRNREALRGRCDTGAMRYSFADIEPGRYYVWITLGSSRPMGSAVVDVADRMVERDIEVGVDDPDRYVIVQVLGPDGESLEGASFSTSYIGPGVSSSGGVEALRRTDGTWLIAPDPRMEPMLARYPGGTHRLRISHRELGSREVTFEPGKQRELGFRFGAASTLSVEVSGLDEYGLVGRASLELRTHLEANGRSGPVKSARSGGSTFVFDKVQPTRWLLVLVVDSIHIDRMEIELAEGENRIDWPLPPLSTVTLEFADPTKSSGFLMRRVDSDGNWIRLFGVPIREGEAVYPYVAPGRYELSGTYDGESRSITIDVPAQTYVRVE